MILKAAATTTLPNLTPGACFHDPHRTGLFLVQDVLRQVFAMKDASLLTRSAHLVCMGGLKCSQARDKDSRREHRVRSPEALTPVLTLIEWLSDSEQGICPLEGCS